MDNLKNGFKVMLFVCFCFNLVGQVADTVVRIHFDSISGLSDTVLTITDTNNNVITIKECTFRHNGDNVCFSHQGIPVVKFLGNSWYTSFSYNLAKNGEYKINLGRTNGEFLNWIKTTSWGLGYSFYNQNNQYSHLLSAFGELSLFPGATRIDYIYDLTKKQHYIRPSIGISLLIVDILYNYSVPLTTKNNMFEHGVSFRFKIMKGTWRSSTRSKRLIPNYDTFMGRGY